MANVSLDIGSKGGQSTGIVRVDLSGKNTHKIHVQNKSIFHWIHDFAGAVPVLPLKM